MLQIKTIRNADPSAFDEAVNAALADGWTLTRRLSGPDFIAELEREEITEGERSCENCAHFNLCSDQEPCRSCDENASKWEVAE